jgi:predicted Rossmann-fold nucleotide-binding protein
MERKILTPGRRLILPHGARLPSRLATPVPTAAFLESWQRQLAEGCRLADEVGPGLTWMGSARIDENHWSGYNQKSHELVLDTHRKLQLPGYHGGGPNLMDAVARALQDAKVPSVGLCLSLEALQDGSGRIDVRIDFDDFGPRLAIFKRYSLACFLLPGGIGTFHEASDFIDNIAKLKMAKVPLYFIEFDDDMPFWPGILHGFTEGAMKKFGTVGPKETGLMKIIHARDLVDCVVADWEAAAKEEERQLLGEC